MAHPPPSTAMRVSRPRRRWAASEGPPRGSE